MANVSRLEVTNVFADNDTAKITIEISNLKTLGINKLKLLEHE